MTPSTAPRSFLDVWSLLGGTGRRVERVRPPQVPRLLAALTLRALGFYDY